MLRKLFYLYLLFPIFCSAQKDVHNPKIIWAIETYAYLKGQTAALQKIATEFPSLRNDVAATESNLNKTFGNAEHNIKQYLKEELDSAQLLKFHNQLDSLLHEQLLHPVEKEQYARDFLMSATERSKKISNTALSRGILAFKYHHNPHQEITDGHVHFFETRNHPKADDVDVKIPIPKSWLAEEAEMPQTIQQFTSCNGNGIEKILLVVHDLPAELNKITLNEKSILTFISPETNVIRIEKFKMDDSTAFMVEVEELVETEADMKIRMLQFMLLKDEKLYCLQGSIGPTDRSEDLGKEIKKYEPLFRLVASQTRFD